MQSSGQIGSLVILFTASQKWRASPGCLYCVASALWRALIRFRSNNKDGLAAPKMSRARASARASVECVRAFGRVRAAWAAARHGDRRVV